MTEGKNKNYIKIQKEELESSYKNILRSPSFLQNQRMQQIGFPALVCMFILIFAFQNCGQNNIDTSTIKSMPDHTH